ncbi:MAG: haloacid dehalogenase-like hydrolase [Candidatus Omnitrophota bacterium]|jgi:hypothetical protein
MRHTKAVRQNIIGIVYDFDGTLSPHNMQEDTIFREWGIGRSMLWKKSDRLVRQGYERTLAYLKLLIHDPVFQKRPLDRGKLRRLAGRLSYFPGVPGYFDRINRFLRSQPEARQWGIQLEHYIVSSGMLEILEGARIFKAFKKVYACEYEYGPKGPLFPKLVINDTNKTQFLFRINKGKLEMKDDPNGPMSDEARRIPFRNMIYVGDSQTDIPSMTVVQRYGGHAIAVFNPAAAVPPLVKTMVASQRADHFAPADYREPSLLVRILKLTLKKIVHDIAYANSARMSFGWVRAHRRSR